MRMQRLRAKMHSNVARVLLVMMIFCVGAASNAQAPNPAELRRGAEEFVQLIENKNTAALQKLFSEQGTSFVGGTYALPKVSYDPDEIRKDFQAKRGVYCLFFDTTCFRAADEQGRSKESVRRSPRIPLRSLSGMLAGAKTKSFVIGDNLANGKVSLLLSDRTVDTARLGEDAINFYFRLEAGKWKLRNLEYD